MSKFNNILSREEYIQSVNEGIIGDFVKKGVRNVKKAFGLFVKRVKGIFTIFDNNGNVLPVVPLQTIAEKYSNNKNIEVICPDEISSDIKNLGGSGCKTEIAEKRESDYTDESPNGAAYAKWVEKDYKNSNYYKNLQTLMNAIAKNESKFTVVGNSLNESQYDTLPDTERVGYLGANSGETDLRKTVTTEELKEILMAKVNHFCNDRIKDTRNRKKDNDARVMLVLGAPGIGKSTIPNAVIQEYNAKRKNPKDKISIISINCCNLQPGDIQIPTFPKRQNLLNAVEGDESAEIVMKSVVDGMSDNEKKRIENALKDTVVAVSKSAVQPWLPCYVETKDDRANAIADAYANGGILSSVNRTDNETDMSTGSGGIILLDEFLRANTMIFGEFMNLLLEGRLGEYVLGSKWFFVACSNRPCDDSDSRDAWKTVGGAKEDRFGKVYHLDPNPDEWKAWARTKGFDETLISFIYDEKAKDKTKKDISEFNRWHRVKSVSSSDDRHKPITPRTWMRLHCDLQMKLNDRLALLREDLKDVIEESGKEEAIRQVSKKYNISDKKDAEKKLEEILKFNAETNPKQYHLSDFTKKQLRDSFEEIFDKSFAEEFFEWEEKNARMLNLEEIIKNPDTAPVPLGSGEKPIEQIDVIDSLIDAMRDRYINKKAVKVKDENGEEITQEVNKFNGDYPDNEMSSIVRWVGRIFKDDYNLVEQRFFNILDTDIFKDGTPFVSHTESYIMAYAAFADGENGEDMETLRGYLYPQKKEGEDEEEIDENNELVKSITSTEGKDKFYLDRDEVIDKIHEYAEKYFPWRIKNGKLLNIFESSTDFEGWDDNEKED